MCKLLKNLVNSSEFEIWTLTQQSLTIQAVCLACGECFEGMKSKNTSFIRGAHGIYF